MRDKKLGIIGGGQLGMLLLQRAIELPLKVKVLDYSSEASVAPFTAEFVVGDLGDYETVMAFGADCDLISFDIEKANAKALLDLQRTGKRVVSSPESLLWIQDKGLQREKIVEAGFPSANYSFVEGAKVLKYAGDFPVVQKLRCGGYDGKGVNILRSREDLVKAPRVDSVFEDFIRIEKEISVMVARKEDGEAVVYECGEMVFDDEANLLDLLITPARVDVAVSEKIKQMALAMAKKLKFVGIYTIELFLTAGGEIFVNEISPRPHNSGHHTVSANVCSQYEQQLRILLDLPLGDPKMLSPSVLLNLVAAKGAQGKTSYEGLAEVFALANCRFTFYGKDRVSSFRKMGHVLILEEDLALALEKARIIKEKLVIKGS